MSEPFWTPLGGQPVDYEGEYDPATQYAPGDVVRYGGVDFLAVNPSQGVTPPTSIGPAGVPTGSVTAFVGSVAPTGWLLCDGSAVSRTTYADLFAVMGTTYGVGDGSTTFNLPDLRGRVAVGKGTAGAVDALGDNDGVAVANRRPQHRHTPHSHQYSDNRSPGGGLSVYAAATNTSTGVYSNTVASDGGSGVAADSLDAPAYLVLNYLVKT